MSFFKLIVLTVFPLFILTNSESSFDYLGHICTNETTFTSNSPYHNNLKLILSTLSSSTSTTYNYYNTTSGKYPDTVHALFLCRGDLHTTTCHDCVNSAAKYVVQLCPVQKEAIIWYDKCFIRYSNHLLVYNLNTASCVSPCSQQNITDRGNFSDKLEDLMNDAANEAAYSLSKFATKQDDFWGVQTMYSLVQCIPDLSDSDCMSCFDYAIGFLPIQCSEKQGGAVLCLSCNVRYDNELFYNQTSAAALANSTIATAPPSPDTSALPQSPSSPVPQTFNPPPNHGNGHIPLWKIIAIVVPITAFFVVVLIIWCCFQSSKMKKGQDGKEVKNRKTLQFDFHTIEAATRSFSDENKIGEGGFGIVYWAALLDGQEVAVKRLSQESSQGPKEFKNEIEMIAKLQHRNLVRLLGFCLQGKEKILVYEYVPNKSLDYFLFDPERRGLVDWRERYNIIRGIARGLLYLHRDSQLRIIHRDLKTSNILLDGDMNPKISDFGLARIMEADQNQGNTSRIVGTLGYMPPEYAIRGQFSVKSDVYSFGVIMLEIISGRKNNSFHNPNYVDNLPSFAWRHWMDGTALDMMDESLVDSFTRNQVLRFINIGLLCVQENPEARPTMATVLFMLDSCSSVSLPLPAPQRPAFLFGHESIEMVGNNEELELKPLYLSSRSVNGISISEICPR